MATTFNWIYLGTTTARIDPFEGNANMENAGALVSQTYGTTGDPLYSHITSATMIDNGGTVGALNTDNTISNDQFSTDIGAGTQTFVYDGLGVYNATITYADGTTATVTAVIAQSTTGQLFLAPELTANADTTAFEAKPIVSLTLNSIDNATNANFNADRLMTGWDNGVVDGTAGNDLINSAYVEPIANGSDRIDNGDGTSGAATGWQDDVVLAGAGDDTVLAGAGNDTVDGGTGADSIDGGAGNDSLFGGAGVFNDTILGGLGNDTIDGGEGNDVLTGGDGNDTVFGGAGNDTIVGGAGADVYNGGAGMDFVDYSASAAGVNVNLATGTGSAGDATGDSYSGVDGILGSAFDDTLTGYDIASTNPLDPYTNVIFGNAGNDLIDGRDGGDSLYGGDDNDTVLGGGGDDLIAGDAGNDLLDGGAGADTMTGGLGNDTFTGLTIGDVVDGSEDPGNGDVDILDLLGSGWSKATTNIIFSDASHENGTVEFLDGTGAVIGTMSFSNIETIVPCFTPGTLIETDRGPVAVEALSAGDRVLTRDHGFQTLRWVGRRDLTAAEVQASPQLRPVRIAKGALGPGQPTRDMTVSPQHRILLAGAQTELVAGEPEVLAPAIHLAGRPGIALDTLTGGVSYIHILFDRHEIVLSDGIWTESYQPGAATLGALTDGMRDEVLLLFPHLASDPATAFPAARITLRRHETHAILAA